MKSQPMTSDDYAAMELAAAELSGMSKNPIRRAYNKALSLRYRALSVRASEATESTRTTGTNQVRGEYEPSH